MKTERQEILLKVAKETLIYAGNSLFGYDYLIETDFDNIEEVIENLNDINGILGFDYTLNYDGVEQDIGALADDLQIEFNL